MALVFSGRRLSVVDCPARGSLINCMVAALFMSSAFLLNIFLEQVYPCTLARMGILRMTGLAMSSTGLLAPVSVQSEVTC
jgi:hypothetical protein